MGTSDGKADAVARADALAPSAGAVVSSGANAAAHLAPDAADDAAPVAAPDPRRRARPLSPTVIAQAIVRRLVVVPSVGVGTRRRVRLLALLAVRDEMRFLPGFVANVTPHVDGIVALDDGSSDGSDAFLASRPEVLELLRVPRDRPSWDEPGNHRRLVEAALRHGAGWMVVLDADERVEHTFRDRVERVIRRGGRLGLSSYAVRMRELWDAPDQYRVDGVWGRKAPPRLFRASPESTFDEHALHGAKTPREGRILGVSPTAALEVYHLRMIERADREARRDRYLALDPEARFQPGLGYHYLTDERRLRLRRVKPRRAYRE